MKKLQTYTNCVVIYIDNIYTERDGERGRGNLLMLGRVIGRVRLGSVRPCLVENFSDAFFHVHQQLNLSLYSRSKTLKLKTPRRNA